MLKKELRDAGGQMLLPLSIIKGIISRNMRVPPNVEHKSVSVSIFVSVQLTKLSVTTSFIFLRLFFFPHRLKHENLVDMVGFSCDGQHPCLVYPLMANGSLLDRLACLVSTVCSTHSTSCPFTEII